MLLPEAITLAASGALITRESDKHSDWPWRIAGLVDVSDVETRLAVLRHGQMFPLPGLERRGPDGRWNPVGKLRSHQAQADDWVAFTPTLSDCTTTNVRRST